MHSERGADHSVGWMNGACNPRLKVQESRWLVRPEYETRVSKLAKLAQLTSKPSTEFSMWSRPSRWDGDLAELGFRAGFCQTAD